ncbi:putative disease resistance RPP13-like protein 1 [Macadamia integrifolia]|uniref:putative disease resistance RPP13-like protein 1 n=1 Tax=Macadamia integrifolia TaxID=60698 RepID=UPI001C4F9CAA|nr:putative disease resistance RPP13-like protein 1 [Macadamia integrifolia]
MDELVLNEKKLELYYLNALRETKLHQMTRKPQTNLLRQISSSLVDESSVLGRADDLGCIKDFLLSGQYDQREVPVTCIVGMAGMGKTTLAQLAYNDPQLKEHFDVKLWVCVPEDFDVGRLTSAILEIQTRKACDLNELESLQCELQDRLDGKRFLLVLDDVWSVNRSKWESLRVPFRVSKMGSRILVTSRSQRVSTIMGAAKTLTLQSLSDEDCWLLFKKWAFSDENCNTHLNLIEIGEKIIKKCNGLPLALKSLGGLLRDKIDEKEWEFILKSDLWDLEGDDILPALRLSYHNLPAHLKLCFVYCSLFPKGYSFRKDELVLLWMAEGFVPSKQVERMEGIGNQYFDDLLQRSFFQKENTPQSVRETFVMHDLMHDLAQSVSREVFCRIESDKSCEIMEMARHMSLLIDDLDSTSEEIYGCKRLCTFLLKILNPSVECIRGQIPFDLFEHFRFLRVLDLSFCNTLKLPESIGMLKHLRYLDLSCTYIKELPDSVCNLFNLQTLILNNCRFLLRLPKNLGNLISLQHILMNVETNVIDIPVGIGRLCSLKTLPRLWVGQKDGFKIGELKELRNLQGRLHILGLENVPNVFEATKANMKNKEKLDEIYLQWGEGTRDLRNERDVVILEGLEPHTALKHLQIEGYDDLIFPNWMMEMGVYNKLVALSLSSCKICKVLPTLWQLPSLESLRISRMNELSCLSHEFYGDDVKDGGKKGFQKLKHLELKNMSNLGEWCGSLEGEFPCLEKLVIKECPKIRKLPPFLPTLKELEIKHCDALTSLPRLPFIQDLILANCDERILNCLQHCSSLTSLLISEFQNAINLPQAMFHPLASTLQRLEIDNFSKLLTLEDAGLEELVSVRDLIISGCNGLTSLPKGLHRLISLERLRISCCNSLTSLAIKSLTIHLCENFRFLPRGLKDLYNLQELAIDDCGNIKFLPDMGLPTSLRRLTITRCPDLSIRCQKGREDWPKIAHVLDVNIQH